MPRAAAALDHRCAHPFGQGVDFMESTIAWHYMPMDASSTPQRLSRSREESFLDELLERQRPTSSLC